MTCDTASALTICTLGAVADKSLYEHVPERLIDRITFNHLFTIAGVASIHAYICNVRLRDNSYGV